MQADFKLTTAQMRKLKAGKSFQLSHNELIGQGIKSIHHANIHMEHKDARACEKAMACGKGFRFSPKKVKGGTITFNDIRKNPLVQALAKKGLATIDHSLMANGDINKNQQQVANTIGDNLIAGHTKLAQAQAVKALGEGFPKGTVEAHQHATYMRSNVKEPKRFTKGSVEAKEHMARLRAMRKVKGGNLKGSVSKFIKEQVNNAKDGVKNILLQPNIAPALIASYATGEPLPLIGAIGANTANYAIQKYTGQKGSVSSKNVTDAYKSQQKANGGMIKPRKGSQEMKDKMARVRAMRGGSFILPQ